MEEINTFFVKRGLIILISGLICLSSLCAIPSSSISGDKILPAKYIKEGATNTSSLTNSAASSTIPIISPNNNYHFEIRDDNIFKWGSITPASTGNVKYELKIVEIKTNQTAEQAIAENIVWYDSITSLVTGSDGYEIEVLKRFPNYGKMAWQVSAFDEMGIEIAKSDAYQVWGPPFLEAFYAGNHLIMVDTTTVHDWNHLSGRGRTEVSSSGKMATVSFDDIKIGYYGVMLILQSGTLSHPYNDSITLTPEYAPNGKAKFYIDTLFLDEDYMYVKGVAKWASTFRDTVLTSNRCRLNFEDYRPNGGVSFKSHTEAITSLPGTIIRMDSNSNIYIRGYNKFGLELSGKIINKLPFNGDSISLTFKGIEKTDYFSMIPSNGQDTLKIDKTISVLPISYYFDLSSSVSPGILSSDPAWKGIWINKFKMKLNFDNVNYNLSLPGKDWINVDSEINKKSKYTFNQEEVDFSIDTAFSVKPQMKFNGFGGSLSSLKIKRTSHNVHEDTIKGSVLVPYIDPSKNYEFIYTLNDTHDTAFITEPIKDFVFSPITESTITSFSVLNGSDTIVADINELAKTISFTLPKGSDIKNLIAYFSTKGTEVNINGVKQVRGITKNDFSFPKVYKVMAGNLTYSTYRVSEISHTQTSVGALNSDKYILKVYPNPVVNFLRVDKSVGEVNVSIWSIEGKLIKSFYIDGKTDKIDVSNIPSGIYIFKIGNSKFKAETRFVKQ